MYQVIQFNSIINHFIARGAKPKETICKPKPLDTQAMNCTADIILHHETSPATGMPSGKKTKASRSASAAFATPFTLLSSTVTLVYGRVIQLAVTAAKNDPSKKAPPPEKMQYNPVGDWREGCPYSVNIYGIPKGIV